MNGNHAPNAPGTRRPGRPVGSRRTAARRPVANRRVAYAILALALRLSTAPALAQSVVVKPGDTLSGLALRHGTSVRALSTANTLSGSTIRPGQTLQLPPDSHAGPAGADGQYTVVAGDTLYDIAYAAGVSVAELITINVLDGTIINPGQILRLTPSERTAQPEHPTTVTVHHGDSLWRLARAHGITVASLAAANGLDPNRPLPVGLVLRWPSQTGDPVAESRGGPALHRVAVRPGDTLWGLARTHGTTVGAIYELNRLTTTTLRPGQVLRTAPAGELGAAGPDTLAAAVPALRWPVRGPITSRFGYRRLAITDATFHNGIDIAGRVGDPIRAAITGTVVYSGERGGYGLQVALRTGTIETRYSHASELLVEVGESVEAGDVIARVGSTGLSTGPHLDFEVRTRGTPIDPLPLLQRGSGSGP